jgi:hypothetical protein
MIFGVAVWAVWSQRADGFVSVPLMAWVEAPNAFAAVEGLMRRSGLRFAGHAAASTRDGALVYRADGIRLADGSGCVERKRKSNPE